MRLTQDLADCLDAAQLRMKLPGLPANAIGEQLWCVVGARESHLKAMQQGGWAGFSCSLKDAFAPEAVRGALAESAAALLATLESAELDAARQGLLLDLLEHEITHHGQLIRYVYANRLEFPASWKERYTV
jgi:hypothetical protein